MFFAGSIISLAIRGRTSKKPAGKSNIPNQKNVMRSICKAATTECAARRKAAVRGTNGWRQSRRHHGRPG